MKSAPIWVVGEALIDLLPGEIPVVGGGPANTAKALSRLGLTPFFIGGLSSDQYGRLIESELSSSGIDLSFAKRSELPTARAKVEIDVQGSANYRFSLENTSTFDFGDWLPRGAPSVLYIGSLATVVEPGANALYSWVNSMSVPIVFDPNVRPNVLPDKSRYRSNFEKWAKISTIIKMSDDDLEWLGYSVDEILTFGVDLVVLTKGAEGLSGLKIGEEIFVPGVKVDVVDTVGAGDTVGAVLVEGLMIHSELSGRVLESVLERAARAAALTCTRAGAKPPSLAELDT